MTGELRQALLDALEATRAEQLALARRAVAETPEMAGRYGEEDVRQLLNGFETLLTESVDGGGSETREFFIGTAVPALVADGQSPASLVQGTVTFVTLLATQLGERLPPEHRDEGRVWLAGFFGGYCRDVVAAALEAEQP
ncbi:MAG TPA: hypothetical protein VM290_10575 [Gaiellaceae bacterium]|nr:hypothetical protein [Gaiellaceae bacterium]